MLEKEVLFSCEVSKQEFLLIFGRCGPANNGGARDLTAWVGPGAGFWAGQQPDGAGDWMTTP